MMLDPWSSSARASAADSPAAESAARGDFASQDFEAVFADVNFPPDYEDVFAKARPSNDDVSVSTLNKIIGATGLPAAAAQKIVHTVIAPNQGRVSRNQFFVTLAFAAFAQKNMDMTYENLLAHRSDLPSPSLPYLDALRLNRDTDGQSPARYASILRPPSSLEADPWRSSVTTRISSPHGILGSSPAGNVSPTYPMSSADLQTAPALSSAEAHRRTSSVLAFFAPGSSIVGSEALEWLIRADTVAVHIAPVRGGVVFKHVNYLVESNIHRSSVLHRYSDFWVLSEILARRHPWRLLPHLPPKKVAMNDVFLERRRRGLARYLNFLVRHPVLRTEASVVAFLTEKDDKNSFRRASNHLAGDEFENGVRRAGSGEFSQRELPVLPDLEERVAGVRQVVGTALGHLAHLCAAVDQEVVLQQAYAANLQSFRTGLRNLAEVELARSDCRCCESVYGGLHEMSEHVHEASTILLEHVQSGADRIVENLRRHRELLVYMKELLDRRERVTESAAIEPFARRTAANQSRLTELNELSTSGDSGLVSAQRADHSREVARLKAAIEQDQREVERLALRQTMIQHCVSHELELFHKSTAFLALAFQQYSEDQTRFTGRILDVWRNMTTAAYDMPSDLDAFT